MSPFRRTGLAAAAVFFALAGTALALGTRGAARPVYQQKCATGAVKAVIGLVADPSVGFQRDYTSAAGMFRVRWTCRAAPVQARRVDRGVYDVRVVGIQGTPIVTPLGGPVKVGVSQLGDGGVEVRMLGTVNGAETAVDEAFVVVLV